MTTLIASQYTVRLSTTSTNAAAQLRSHAESALAIGVSRVLGPRAPFGRLPSFALVIEFLP